MIAFTALVAAVWVFLLSRLDPHRGDKGGSRILVLFLFGGVVSGFACLVPYLLVGQVLPHEPLDGSIGWEFFYNFLVVGPVEEGTKFLFFLALSRRLCSIREPRDGLLQAAAVGLGFAVNENVGYGWAYGFDAMLLRSLLTCLSHMVLASIWGSQWTLVYYDEPRRNGKLDMRPVVAALGLAALVHGFRNAMLSVEFLAGSATMAADLTTLIFAFAMLDLFQRRSPYRPFGLMLWRQAIPELELAVRKNPGSWVLNRKLGLYRVRAARYAQALQALDRCQRMRPRSAEIAFYRAIAMVAGGEQRGKDLMRRALEKLPRKSARSLVVSIGPLVAPDRGLRDRLRDVVVECGGPAPWDEGRPTPVPFRIVRVEATRAGAVTKRRVRLGTRELREAALRLSRS